MRQAQGTQASAAPAATHAAVIYRPEPWWLIDQELAARGKRRMLRLAAPHCLTVLEAVAASDLVAVMPERLARRYEASLRLQVRPVPFPMPVFHTRMAWHQQMSDDAGHAWLRQKLIEAAAAGRNDPRAGASGLVARALTRSVASS